MSATRTQPWESWTLTKLFCYALILGFRLLDLSVNKAQALALVGTATYILELHISLAPCYEDHKPTVQLSSAWD